MPEPIGVMPPETMPPIREQGTPLSPVRRRRRVGRWIVLGFAVLVVAFLATVADAYFQAVHAGRELKTLVPMLERAREDLLSGTPDAAARFEQAEAALREVRASVDGARFTFGWTAAIPFVGRPVKAVQLGAGAAEEAMAGLRLGRQVVADVTGEGGSGVLHDGTVDLALVRTLQPRISAILDHLVAARADLARIPSIPLFPALDGLRSDAVAQADDALRSGRRAMQGVALLPTLLGADGPRTYFLALQNNADLRGTGGAVLAWGLVRVADGGIHLQDGGSINEFDQPHGTPVALPQPVRWYHDHTRRPLVINNGANYTPNFPAVASVWAAQVQRIRHERIDGIIAIDPAGAAALFAGQPAVSIPSAPVPIDASTIASFTEHGQYSLPESVQRELPGQLIGAAFGALTNPRDVLQMTRAVGTALADKRIQLWLRDGRADREVHALGWDGAIRPGTGDYIYLVDNKRNPNKVDFFSRTSVDYTIRLDPDGTGHASADVTLDTNVPRGESPTVVGPDTTRYGLNIAMLGLHVPDDALTTSHSSTGGVNYRTKPLGFLAHKESGVKVFTQTVASWSGHPAELRVAYDIPGVARRNPGGGWTYTLTLQHQPVVHPLHLTVTVVAPAGARITGAQPGWKVDGARATLEMDLTRDTSTSLTYVSEASSTP